LQRHLNNQLHIAKLQKQLRDDMQTEFGEAQKRAYLREQLRHIQKELGEGDGSDEQLASLRSRLEAAQLPEKAKEHAERELRRLEAIPAASPEHSVLVTYLETLAELPWNVLTEDQLDLQNARAVLERDHHGLARVKKRILEFLAVRSLNPEGRGPILCFLGPPGVGKTSLGQSIADALGRKFTRISVGGLRDESEIRGHRRTYIGSMPGRIIQEIRRAGARNPVVMLDEVDKIGMDFRGDPASALLEVLDPRQNHSFVDRYLDVPFDLSQIIFIATANTIDPVPAPLRDRMEIIEIPGYTEQEKLHIARGYLVPRQLKENGLSEAQCLWPDDALRLIVEDYTREAGVRNLEREIGSVIRHVAAGVAAGNTDTVTVDKALIAEALGPPRFVREENLNVGTPGVVNGLAYTPVGGEVLHIEALRYPGTGKVTLTGHLGEVMKESVKAAMSLVRSRCAALGIDCDSFSQTDVHVHVPAGAIPKDGPSAGIAMFTALASLFSDRPVRPDVAMTGEISLRGLVLPIGGLKEKALAALRAGIHRVIIPALNEKDLPDLPTDARKELDIIPVRTIDDVLPLVLEPANAPV
jgi:ATP-dependent Lon protease